MIAGNVGRRMGGFFAWGQWYGNQTVGCTENCVTSIGPDMRQLWLDNEVLDENGVRNYMSNAKHTQEGARLRNITSGNGAAQQDVDVMGSFQVSANAAIDVLYLQVQPDAQFAAEYTHQ